VVEVGFFVFLAASLNTGLYYEKKQWGCMPVTKQCKFCGKFFIPDPRVKERQKACSNPECKKKRKKASQDAWVQKNPGYFIGNP